MGTNLFMKTIQEIFDLPNLVDASTSSLIQLVLKHGVELDVMETECFCAKMVKQKFLAV